MFGALYEFLLTISRSRDCRHKMSGVSRDAPIGIQFIQRIQTLLCPRLRVNRLRCYQVSILFLTYLTYMTYHLTRKPISVVKSVLHRNCSELIPPPDVDPSDEQWCNWAPFNTSDANTLLGTLDSAFLFTYAGAMFISGMIAERVDLRYFLSLGMLLSGSFCYLFGMGKTYSIHNIYFYLIVQAGAGICQTTGWPGTVALVGKWFGNSKKGLIFGIWNSHTSLGNILGTLVAGAFVESDWAQSFMWPGVLMAAAGALVWLALVPEPAHVALGSRGPPSRRESCSSRSSRKSVDEDEPSQVIVGDHAASLRPNRHSANAAPLDAPAEATESTSLLSRREDSSRDSSRDSAVSLARALAIPGVLEFSLSLLFAKLVSYTFLYWLPLYINASTHLPPQQSGSLSTLFDVGGMAGAVAAGALADASGAPAAVCVLFFLLAAPALFLYQRLGGAALLLAAGALVNGPYALITTAVSADLGTHSSLAGNSRALATVTAIIDGTGSVGAALGPLLAGVVSGGGGGGGGGGWPYVFYMLITCDLLALLLLLRVVRSEFIKLRHERRMAMPRDARIE